MCSKLNNDLWFYKLLNNFISLPCDARVENFIPNNFIMAWECPGFPAHELNFQKRDAISDNFNNAWRDAAKTMPVPILNFICCLPPMLSGPYF